MDGHVDRASTLRMAAGTYPTPSARGSGGASRYPAAAVGDDEAPVRAAREPDESTGLQSAAPFLFFGGGSVVAALWLKAQPTATFLGRVPIWFVLLALGIIALIGAVLMLLATPDLPGESRPPRVPASDRTPSARGRVGPARLSTARPPPTSRRTYGRPIPRLRPAPPPRPARALRPAGAGRNPSSRPVVDPSGDPLEELGRIEQLLRPAGVARNPADPPATALLGVPDRPGTGRRDASPAPLPSPTELASPPAVPAAAPTPVPPSTPPARARRPEGPRVVCVGCGSRLLGGGRTTQCRECGELLCEECWGRASAEGTPELCPVCAILVESRSRSDSARRARA